jgi:hypothetical protein
VYLIEAKSTDWHAYQPGFFQEFSKIAIAMQEYGDAIARCTRDQAGWVIVSLLSVYFERNLSLLNPSSKPERRAELFPERFKPFGRYWVES